MNQQKGWFIICITVTVKSQGPGYSRNTEHKGWSLPQSSMLSYLAGMIFALQLTCLDTRQQSIKESDHVFCCILGKGGVAS